MAFPVIAKPDLGGFSEAPHDFTIRAGPSVGGYSQTRAGNTRATYDYYLPWQEEPLSAADYALLKAHWEAMGIGGAIFSWTHPTAGTTHNCRYKAIERFVAVSAGDALCWAGAVTLEEV